MKKATQLVNGATGNSPLDSFDYSVFHTPNCKLVAKSYARLLYNDYLANPQRCIFKDIPAEVKEIDYESSLSDKRVGKTFMALTQKRFSERVQPTLMAATTCGNSYTASVYFGLVSLLSNVQSKELLGKRVGFFSYGSGLASSMFSLRVKGDTDEMASKLNLIQRLEARKAESPEFYDEVSIHSSAFKSYASLIYIRCADCAKRHINNETIPLRAALKLLPLVLVTLSVLTRYSDEPMRLYLNYSVILNKRDRVALRKLNFLKFRP